MFNQRVHAKVDPQWQSEQLVVPTDVGLVPVVGVILGTQVFILKKVFIPLMTLLKYMMKMAKVGSCLYSKGSRCVSYFGHFGINFN